MASSPITSWQIDEETVETVTDFIFLGSKITAESACSHEIKRHLLLGRKVMTNLDSILKSKHHFADKDAYSQSYLKLKEDSEKAGLNLSIQKMKIMASSPIISCQIDGETMKQ